MNKFLDVIGNAGCHSGRLDGNTLRLIFGSEELASDFMIKISRNGEHYEVRKQAKEITALQLSKDIVVISFNNALQAKHAQTYLAQY